VKKGQRDRATFIVEWCSQGPNRRSVAPVGRSGAALKSRALLGGGLRQQLERGAVHLPLIDKGVTCTSSSGHDFLVSKAEVTAR
jgi:hypothetical protein